MADLQQWRADYEDQRQTVQESAAAIQELVNGGAPEETVRSRRTEQAHLQQLLLEIQAVISEFEREQDPVFPAVFDPHEPQAIRLGSTKNLAGFAGFKLPARIKPTAQQKEALSVFFQAVLADTQIKNQEEGCLLWLTQQLQTLRYHVFSPGDQFQLSGATGTAPQFNSTTATIIFLRIEQLLLNYRDDPTALSTEPRYALGEDLYLYLYYAFLLLQTELRADDDAPTDAPTNFVVADYFHYDGGENIANFVMRIYGKTY